MGLLVWGVLAVGFAMGVLPRARPSRSVLLLLAALASYAAWNAISLFWTQSKELTTEELARSLDYLGLAALATALLDRASWRAAAGGLGLGAMLVCVIALGSRLDPSVFGTDRVDLFLRSDRLSRPFGYWNAVGAWGTMCTALGLVWSAHDPSRARRALSLGLVPVAVTMTYLTYSRAAVFGGALAVVAGIALSRNRITALCHTAVAAGGATLAILAVRGSPQIAHATGTRGAGKVFGVLVVAVVVSAAAAVVTRWAGVDSLRIPAVLRRPLVAVGALAVLVSAATVGPRLASHAWHSFTRMTPVRATVDPAGRLANLSGTRYPYWKSAIAAFDAHPADGTGAGTFEFWWNQHGTTGDFVQDTHNIWLENMAELGVPGLLLIIAVAVAAIGVAVTARIRARRDITAGVTAAFLAVTLVYLLHASVDWMWESTAVTVFALGGVAAVGVRLSRGRLRLGIAARAVLVAGAAAAAIVQLPGMFSTTDLRNSQATERAGNSQVALAQARDAVSAEPWSASAYEQEALVLEAGGRLHKAKHQESLAISYEPTNYAHWLVRSRIETELGQLNAAVGDYGRAVQLRPHALVFALGPYFRIR
jgi:hypothetical protein